MSDVLRVKKVIKWLMFLGMAENEAGIAEILNYNSSSFSQIINGKTKISKKFVENLCRLNEKLNSDWVLTGNGEMLMGDKEKIVIESKILVREMEFSQMKIEMLEKLLHSKEELLKVMEERIIELKSKLL